MTNDTQAIHHAAEQEIRRFHDVLVAWFTGDMDQGAFDHSIDAVVHPDFHWVSPSGQDVTRQDILEGLKSGHGSNPDFKITVDDVRLVASDGNLAVLSYVESQTGARNAPPENTRKSTVVFALQPRLQWLYLHECYRESA